MLADALDSVATQGWPEIERILINGGSTDGTLGLIDSLP
jgi:glycosyltransferase involved in cell wall biosynthesis